jgi:hypothetical protein
MTARTSTYAKARFISKTTLALGGIAVASVAVRLALEMVRRSDECPTAITVAFEWLVWTAIVSSVLALLLGVVALAARADRTGQTVVGMALAVGVAVVMFVPGVATILCGDAAA